MEVIKTHTVRVPGGTRTATLMGPTAAGTYRVIALIKFDSGNHYTDRQVDTSESEATKLYEYEVRVNKSMGFEKLV